MVPVLCVRPKKIATPPPAGSGHDYHFHVQRAHARPKGKISLRLPVSPTS